MRRVLIIAAPLLFLVSCSDFLHGGATTGNGELKEIVRQYNDLVVEKEAGGHVARNKYQDLVDRGSDVILHDPQSITNAAPNLRRSFLKAFEDCWANAEYNQNPFITLKVLYNSAKQGAPRQAAAKPAASQPVKAKQDIKPVRSTTKHDSSKKSAQSSHKQNKAATPRPVPQIENLYNKPKSQPDNQGFKAKIFRA